jgi:hypothetical protein
MPSFDTPIVIYDGQSTPVAHTFGPENKNSLEASYVDRVTGLSVGFPRIKVNHVLADRNQPLNKVRVRINVPELEVIGGTTEEGYTPAPRLAFSENGDCQFVFHERASKQQRKTARMYMANFLLTATAEKMIDDLEPAY